MKRWIYDLEMYPNLFLFYCKNVNTLEYKWFAISPYHNDLNALIQFLKEEVTELVGFNNLQYDYPLLHHLITNRTKYDKLSLLIQSCFNKSQELVKSETAYFNIVRNPFIKQIDLFKIHHYDNKAKLNSLKHLQFNLRNINIQSLPYKFDTVLNKQQIDNVIKYCLNDVDTTYDFYLKSIDEITLREQLSETYNIDFTNYNGSKLGESIFIMEFEKDGSVIVPAKPEPIDINKIIFPYVSFQSDNFNALLKWFQSKIITETKGVFSDIPLEDLDILEDYYYKDIKKKKNVQKNLNILYKDFKFVYGTGGIHGAIKSGIYISDDKYIIKSCDVASLYPNLGIQNNVFPPHLSEKFCIIYNNLYELRKTFPKGTAMNLAIKLALNATYGKSNSQFSKLFAPLYTMTITINGQLLLTMLAEELMNIPDSQILMINTDGLEIKIPREYESLYNDICKKWEAITKLDLEYVDYNKMVIANVNNYIAVTTKGKVKRKGALFIYDIAPGELEYHKNHSMLIVPKAREAYFINGIQPEEFIKNHNDVFDFFKRVKLNRNDKLIECDLIGKVTEEYIGKSDKLLTRETNKLLYTNDKELERLTRYYVANRGKTLLKVMPPLLKKPDEERESNIEAGFLCIECNNLKSNNKIDIMQAIKDNINYDYYLNEINKIIKKIENNEEIEEDIENNV